MKTFVIAATGPSFSLRQARSIGIAKVRHPALQVMTVNDAVYPCWFADIAYACDAAWWREHRGLAGFGGWKVRLFLPGLKGQDTNATPEYPDIDTFYNSGVEGFDEDPSRIRNGGNSGYQATHIAAHLGAQKIILVGFDMRNEGTLSHFFGEHPATIRKRPIGMRIWVERFHRLHAELAKRKIVVLNASPGSALTDIRRVELDHALGEI